MSSPGTPTTRVTGPADETPPWTVRAAATDDVPAVASALADLLAELGGQVPPRESLEVAVAQTIADPERGCLLVAATNDGELVGVLAASFQHAVHVPGRYCILQDLWTHPASRGEGVGGALVTALTERLRAVDLDRLEVGLPSSRFEHLAETEAFYGRNGFQPLGPRMRRVLR